MRVQEHESYEPKIDDTNAHFGTEKSIPRKNYTFFVVLWLTTPEPSSDKN